MAYRCILLKAVGRRNPVLRYSIPQALCSPVFDTLRNTTPRLFLLQKRGNKFLKWNIHPQLLRLQSDYLWMRHDRLVKQVMIF